jgi:hypothetical protein
LLMLSQKGIRLLRCSAHRFQEVLLPASVPQSLEEAGAFAVPDHALQNRSAAGPSTGAMGGVHFGTASDRETRDQYLYHFYRTVDRSLSGILRRDYLPLVLTGVSYEVALYRRLTGYPHVVPGAVHGSPHRLSDTELHRRAVEMAQPLSTVNEQKLLAEFQRMSGLKLASTDMRDILEAARNGRVRWTLLTDNTEAGEPVTSDVTAENEACNEAALETIIHSGQVWLLKQDSMPERSRIAAIFRY